MFGPSRAAVNNTTTHNHTTDHVQKHFTYTPLAAAQARDGAARRCAHFSRSHRVFLGRPPPRKTTRLVRQKEGPKYRLMAAYRTKSQ